MYLVELVKSMNTFDSVSVRIIVEQDELIRKAIKNRKYFFSYKTFIN